MNSKKRSPVSKDEFSLWIGLFVLVLSLRLFIGIEVQGWGLKTTTLAEISRFAITISKNYESLCCIILMVLFINLCQTLFLFKNKQSTISCLKY